MCQQARLGGSSHETAGSTVDVIGVVTKTKKEVVSSPGLWAFNPASVMKAVACLTISTTGSCKAELIKTVGAAVGSKADEKCDLASSSTSTIYSRRALFSAGTRTAINSYWHYFTAKLRSYMVHVIMSCWNTVPFTSVHNLRT